jgi:hypothetical protein
MATDRLAIHSLSTSNDNDLLNGYYNSSVISMYRGPDLDLLWSKHYLDFFVFSSQLIFSENGKYLGVVARGTFTPNSLFMLLLDPEDGSILASGLSPTLYFGEFDRPNFFITDSNPPEMILQGSMALELRVTGAYIAKFVMN